MLSICCIKKYAMSFRLHFKICIDVGINLKENIKKVIDTNNNIEYLQHLWYTFKYIIEVELMAISYKKLWKLLIDKELKKGELAEKAGISKYTLNKLKHGENVNTETLAKICVVLDCNFDDIMEITSDYQSVHR